MASDPNKPRSPDSDPAAANAAKALDVLIAEAMKLLQEMKSFLRQQRQPKN